MKLMKSKRNRRLPALALALLFPVSLANAQEVSKEHMTAAYAMITAINATDAYDGILPEIAFVLKQELIVKDPDLQPLISSTVDEYTIGMAARRGDLEREAALAYAKVFTAEELKTIADFYASEVGKKLIEEGPIVTRQIADAATIWQRGVARDLAVAVGEQLAAVTKQKSEESDETVDNQ